MKRKNLVILRCGKNSIHKHWMSLDRNWDLAISTYDSEVKYDGEIHHFYKGSKWEGIADILKKRPNIVENYDFFWFPDDDLAIQPNEVNRLFNLTEEFGLSLSQPALKFGNYFSHFITLKVPFLRYREVNFVEIMCPCFSREALSKTLDSFSLNQSGWGLEFVWQNVLEGMKIGIIDQVEVIHTRPVGSVGSGGSNNPRQDLRNIYEAYPDHSRPSNIKRYPIKASKKYLLYSHVYTTMLKIVLRIKKELL